MFEKYDVCLVEFVFKDDINQSKYRPCLVLDKDIVIPIAQITSHEPRIDSDYQIKDLLEAGLDKNSTIRFNYKMKLRA